MKKALFALSAALIAAASAAPEALAAEARTEPVGVYAVVTDGTRHYTGSTQSWEQLRDGQAYELYVQKQPVLSVGAAAEAKRYHVDFMLPDSSEEVYLTGLSAANVEEIQQAVLDSYIGGKPMYLNNLHFIDAEKTKAGDNDDNLCWAASCSNLLTYTGWAQQAGFQTEDEVFDLYVSSFTNNGGFQRNGLAWFFNGVALGTNKVRRYPDSGGYLRNYAYDMVCNFEYVSGMTEMNRMLDRLKSGCGVSPGVGIIYDGEAYGGHTVTLWGYVLDTSLDANDPNRCRAVFITDSDSDMTEKTDRTKSVNLLEMYPVCTRDGSVCFEYGNGVTAVFEDYTYLLPCSTEVPQEREVTAARNKIGYPDLCFGIVYLSESKNSAEQNTLFESGAAPYVRFCVENASDKAYRAALNVSRQVTDQNGRSFLNGTVTIGGSRLDLAETTGFRVDRLGKLPAGDYTLTLKVNDDRPVKEAYYYNNTYTLGFKVRDSYKLGDCDGNGTIDVRDVTFMQQMLTDRGSRNVKAAERGNIRGEQLTIADATLLQSHLAAYETNAPIGEKRLYSVI